MALLSAQLTFVCHLGHAHDSEITVLRLSELRLLEGWRPFNVKYRQNGRNLSFCRGQWMFGMHIYIFSVTDNGHGSTGQHTHTHTNTHVPGPLHFVAPGKGLGKLDLLLLQVQVLNLLEGWEGDLAGSPTCNDTLPRDNQADSSQNPWEL